MSAKILEGKSLANRIKEKLAEKISVLKNKYGKTPFLYAVDTNYDRSSGIYLEKEIKVCHKLGIKTHREKIMPEISVENFKNLLKTFSADKKCDAILVPHPLPKHLTDISIWEHLNPDKDIDGVSVMNKGRLFACKSFAEIENGDFFVPCTAMAVVELIRHYDINISGKKVTVLGRSTTVGRPLAHMLTALDATVTLCHSKTKNLPEILQNSAIVISAIGRARFIKAEMVRSDTIIMDVGTNTDNAGIFCGDVDYGEVSKKVSAITPVPGGVGPVTLAYLIRNIVHSAYKSVLHQ